MITIAIPVYNEERHLSKTVENVIESAGIIPIEIIIIDDASIDSSKKIIENLVDKHSFVRGIFHKKNQGVGSGIREAINFARYDKFIIIPGDDDLSKELIKKIFENRNSADMILSYYVNKEERGRVRNIISAFYGLMYMTVFDVYVQYINGVCLYPTNKIRELSIKSDRFSFAAEMTIKCLLTGCSYCEVSGRMQRGLENSTSLSIRNLIEVIFTFFRLYWEIKIKGSGLFNKRGTRIYPI